MNNLRLEELEQRDLLNAAYHVPPPAPRGSDDFRPAFTATRPAFAVNRSAFASFGDDFARPSWDAPQRGPVSEFSLRSFGGESFLIVPVREIVVVVISVQTPPVAGQNDGGLQSDGGGSESDGGVTTPTPSSRPVKVPTPSAPDTTPTVPETTPAVVDAGGIRAQAAVTAARPASQTTPFALVPAANVPTVAADPRAVASATIQNFHGLNGGVLGAPGSVLPASPSSGAVVVGPAGETVEPPEAQPEAAALPGVLATLSAGDITALGRELGQFLTRIEKPGEELVGDGDGLRPWLIAGAAAATACEIARRQLKRAAELAAEEVTDIRPDQLFVG